MLRPLRNHLTACALLLAVHWAPHSQALEVLAINELVSHCVHLDSHPEGADGQYCSRYDCAHSPARVTVEDSLRHHYPCDE